MGFGIGDSQQRISCPPQRPCPPRLSRRSGFSRDTVEPGLGIGESQPQLPFPQAQPQVRRHNALARQPQERTAVHGCPCGSGFSRDAMKSERDVIRSHRPQKTRSPFHALIWKHRQSPVAAKADSDMKGDAASEPVSPLDPRPQSRPHRVAAEAAPTRETALPQGTAVCESQIPNPRLFSSRMADHPRPTHVPPSIRIRLGSPLPCM